MTEVYGYGRTRQVIWQGFASNALMIMCIELAILLPPAPNWHMQDEFAALLGTTPRIAVGSLLAYWTGEFVNSYVIARMVTSTLAGQMVDSVIFITVAFAGRMSSGQLAVMIVAFKVLYEILLTPVTGVVE